MFKKILIANRGEIACRVITSARAMGVKTVAVYSEADRRAMHVRMADEAVCIGPAPSTESYLCGNKIIQAALDTGAQAIHPGYGFLSENAEFSKNCKKSGVVFIGPSAASIEAMGLKDRAKEIMEETGVPVVPGYRGENQDIEFLTCEADKIGYPILIKAVAGGGGKGMRLVEEAKNFEEALGTCQREAKAAFGNDHVLLEKFIVQPRHIEVQVFGDSHGNVVHLFERDCSLQRRHQKVVEEAPAPYISDKFRKDICNAAVRAASAINYTGAGTIEFIASENEEFYFMEMNTRLQVEHPVTEMITGIDLVEWQLRVAAGEKLPRAQKDIQINGHAFEARIYAEDPANEFFPQTGKISHFIIPDLGDNLRVDAGVKAGDSVSIYYDPMIAKIITHDTDSINAAKKMSQLLQETHITGVPHNQEFIANVFAHEKFLDDALDTGFIARHETNLIPKDYGRAGKTETALATLYFMLGLDRSAEKNPWDTRDNWRIGQKSLKRSLKLVNRDRVIEIEAICRGTQIEMDEIKASLISHQNNILRALIGDEEVQATILPSKDFKNRIAMTTHGSKRTELHILKPEQESDQGTGDGKIIAPMPGKIVRVLVADGETVETGQPLLVMESMKVEITIKAPVEGVVENLRLTNDAQVTDGTILMEIAA